MFFDHRLFEDRRDDLQLAAAVRAVRHVDLESGASVQTNLYSSDVSANTRLRRRAELGRTGPWCAQLGSRLAGGAARRCMNSSDYYLAGRALAELGPYGWHQ